MQKTPTRRMVAPVDKPRSVVAVTKTVAKGGHSYVRKQPDTRVPAMLLMLLYPLGQMGHSLGWSPGWLAVGSPVAAAAVWLAVSRQFGTGRYTRVVTLSFGLVPVWLAVAATVGVFHLDVLVCYSVAAVILWAVYVKSEILAARRQWRAAKLDWRAFRDKVGLDLSELRETRPTRLGEEYVIDVLPTGKLTSKLVTPALSEGWAMHRGLPSDARVVVRADPKNSRQILVEERTRDPWQEPNLHPTLDQNSEWALPARRSIHDGPIEVGADPSSGHILSLPVYAEKSCKHVLVIATTGGGKTTLVNCVIERVTACNDTLVWAVDTTKGTISGLWRDAIDWGAGVGEHHKALTILRAAKTVIEERSRATDGENHHATPQAPLIVLLVDEAGSMQGGMSTRMAAEYRENIGFVYRSARSGGVILVFISQRGVIQHTGSGDVRANAAIRAVLRVEHPGEMDYPIPDWQAAGFPDMSKYAGGYAGVVAIQAPGQRPSAGRTWDLSDFPTVRALAADRGEPSARLEAWIVAKLGESYATRRRREFARVAAAPAPETETEEAQVSDIDRQVDAFAQSLETLDQAADTLKAMQIPEGERVSIGALQMAREELDRQVAADRKIGVPEHIYKPVLGLLRAAGDAGVSRGDLLGFFEPRVKGRTVERWLRLMVDDGIVVRQGATSTARYRLPEPYAE
jgi:hypothetical protein